MLVLTRKPGQTIVVDGKIHITILGSKGTSTRLGIEAPGDVPILRAELICCESDGPQNTIVDAVGRRCKKMSEVEMLVE